MSERDINVLLWVLSVLLLGIGMAQLLFTERRVGGLCSITIGISLIVVAASTRKKINNG